MFLAQNAGTIQGRVLLQVSLKVRVLFEGGHYSRAGLNNDFTVCKMFGSAGSFI